MPTGADKNDHDHNHWRRREAVWAGWGNQEAYDKKMADTKEKCDMAHEVHQANHKKERGGMFSHAANEPSGNTSIPVMVELLGDGLCADQGEGDIEISDGVY
ncbi:unnamed protein product [Ectocarpus sp. 6 AP-2014]